MCFCMCAFVLLVCNINAGSSLVMVDDVCRPYFELKAKMNHQMEVLLCYCDIYTVFHKKTSLYLIAHNFGNC